MEDIINALLDVVRAQHSATEGTDEAPFNMDDIVDMAMNLMGRPDEASEEKAMIDSIEKMVESLAPDIFPPKTFEEMDDNQKILSAASMIENRFMRNNSSNNSAPAPTPTPAPQQSSYSYQEDDDEEEEVSNPAELNDIIYKNFMEMMGLSAPQVEFPFDRSQIRYGKEKSVTEMLADEEEEKAQQAREESERQRKLSAWELAQNAIDTDEAKHAKEPYVPKPVEQPAAKSASQMAAEAIRRSEEQDRMQLEIERQAEALMAEARKRGQDPMKFMLHQQEILQYMEKNTDELVSFEDYEDLSPEEKMEIERQIYVEKQLAEGVSPDEVDTEVPEEYIPEELKGQRNGSVGQNGSAAAEVVTTFDEDTLRALSQQVVSENSSMILENSDEDIAAIQEEIFQNLKAMMAGSGTSVAPEDIGQLLAQAAANSMEADSSASQGGASSASQGASSSAGNGMGYGSASAGNGMGHGGSAAPASGLGQAGSPFPTPQPAAEIPRPEPARPMSAVELAMAAQKAMKPEPQEEVRNTVSAADLAKAAQEMAKKNPAPEAAEASVEEAADELDMNFDELDDLFDADDAAGTSDTNASDEAKIATALQSLEQPAAKAAVESGASQGAGKTADTVTDAAKTADAVADAAKTAGKAAETAKAAESFAEEVTASASEEDDDEYEYVDPDELVLGEHTQAEIDEAMENLNTLGLEGEVFERAKRMLLLELAGSEAALEAWLFEQENSKKKKKANVSALDEEDLDDLSDFDEDLFEKELEMAIDEDFEEEISEDLDDETDDELTESEEIEADDDGAEDSDSADADDDDIEDGEDDIIDEDIIDGIDGSDEINGDDEIEEISEEKVIIEEASEVCVEEIPEVTEEKEEVVKEVSEAKEKKAKAHRGVKNRKAVVHKKEKKAKADDADQKVADNQAKVADKKAADSQAKAADKKAADNQAKVADKKAADSQSQGAAEERGYQVSVRKPFVLKNSFSYMDKFEDFITESQENRKLSTGFKKLDGMLRFGLHKGSYFIDAQPQYLKNSFMQQIADRAAESGVDVLYISTELSRYDLMVDTISRLSYEMNGQDPDKAHSVMAIMTGEDGATLESLADELNWYRGRISEHLFILDQESVDEFIDSMEEESAGTILEELIRSIVREGAHKPVVFIDNIENILSVEDSEDMKPLMEGIKKLAKELSIPIVMSYGYAQAESEEELSADEIEFHESLGNMCDVYLELQYADMITEDSIELTDEDIREMVEDGDSLLIDILIHRNRRPMRASCQIQGTPKYNFFEE